MAAKKTKTQRTTRRTTKSGSAPKVRAINIKLTEAEYAAIEEATGGYPVHTWARLALFQAAGMMSKKRSPRR
jgi:hypothetical protein